MSVSKQKVSFSSKFGSLLSVMRDHSSIVSYMNFKMLLTKVIHQSANFQTCNCWHENSRNSLCYFLTQKSVFSSNFASPFIFMRHSLLQFFIQNFTGIGQKETCKFQMFRILTVRIKVNQITYVIFQATNQFSF